MSHVVYAISEGQKFNTDHSLEVVTCPSCRIVYAIPHSLADSARAYPGNRSNGWNICCPMGHEWHYTGKSITEQLEDERRRVKATRDLLEHEQRSHSATRGHLTRQKRRAAAGTCPCCNRTFQQLARHMAGQHPEYVERVEGHLPADVPKPEVQPDPDIRDAAVREYLGDGERRWSEIRDHLGLGDHETATLITRLLARGQIERVERGIYKRTT